MRHIFILTFFLLSSTAYSLGYERFVVSWVTQCGDDEDSFLIISKSKNGWDDGDDHQLFFGKSEEPLDTMEALYVRSALISDVQSICKDLPVFKLSKDLYLLWLRYDHRPSLDSVSVALYSTKKATVVSKIENIGKIYGKHMTIIKTEKGFKVRLWKYFLKDPGADSIVNYVERWMQIVVEENKISAHWL